MVALPDPGLSFVDGGPSQCVDSLWTAMEFSFGKHKHKVALIEAHQPADHLQALVGKSSNEAQTDELDCLAWTYEQLLCGALRIAMALKNLGIEPGSDTILMTAVPNGGEFWLLYLACMLLRIHMSPVDARCLEEARRDQLEWYFDHIRPRIVVVSDAPGAQAVEAVQKGATTAIKLVLDWDKRGPYTPQWRTLDAFLATEGLVAKQAILEDARTKDHDRIAYTVFTSGTSTGHPKGCLHTVRSILHMLDTPRHTWGRQNARYLCDSANYWVSSMAFGITLWAEGRVPSRRENVSTEQITGGTIIQSDFNPNLAKMISAIKSFQVTDTLAVATLLRRILMAPSFAEMYSVTFVALTGDVVTRTAVELVPPVFPKAKSYANYGMSEGGNIFGWTPGPSMRYFGEVATNGTVRPGVRAKVVGPGEFKH